MNNLLRVITALALLAVVHGVSAQAAPVAPSAPATPAQDAAQAIDAAPAPALETAPAAPSSPSASTPDTGTPVPTSATIEQPAPLDTSGAAAQGAAATDGEGLSPELIAELDHVALEQTASAEKPDLIRFYGFFDFGARYIYDTDGAPQGKQVIVNHSLRESGGWTFTPTATNLYIDAQPLPSTRGLIELRFMLQGASRENSRQVVSVSDETSPYGFGITSAALLSIERAQIEQHIFDWLQIRAGMWLTPSGIWNEDHGIPTLISMWLPEFVLQEQIPLRQVGLQLYGGVRFGDYRLDYNAYVSNGRPYAVTNGGRKASEHELFDYDSDKAFGYRLRFSRSYPFYVHFGTSFYAGTYEEFSREIPTETGPGVGKTIGWKELSVAFDAALDYKGLRLRSELIVTATRYDPGFAPTSGAGVTPDNNAYDGYITLAYRLPALLPNLEPYLYWELSHRPSTIGDGYALGSLGFNYYLNSASQLKLQWVSTAFFDWKSHPGVAFIGLPTDANDLHTGHGKPYAVGTPGGLSLHYVLTF